MVFSEEQIREILRLVDFTNTAFVAGNISTTILSESDKQILSDFGIDISKLKTDYTPYEQLYYFGRLASILGPLNAQKVTFSDLKKYLQRGQFIPLSDSERDALTYLENKSYSYIKGLGEDIKASIVSKIEDENLAKRSYYEKVIGDSLKRAVIERDSVKSVVSEIGLKTGDWERDLGRIAETELQNAYEYGKGASFYDKYGNKRVYYKEVYPGACKHCIRLYLTNGIGSEPKLFTYQELLDNGTNIGRKVDSWKATLGTVHPFCRCDLRVKRDESDVWDKEKGMYVPSVTETPSKGKIKVFVGDKVFEV